MWAELRALAQETDPTISALLTEAIREGLTRRRRGQVREHDFAAARLGQE